MLLHIVTVSDNAYATYLESLNRSTPAKSGYTHEQFRYRAVLGQLTGNNYPAVLDVDGNTAYVVLPPNIVDHNRNNIRSCVISIPKSYLSYISETADVQIDLPIRRRIDSATVSIDALTAWVDGFELFIADPIKPEVPKPEPPKQEKPKREVPQPVVVGLSRFKGKVYVEFVKPILIVDKEQCIEEYNKIGDIIGAVYTATVYTLGKEFEFDKIEVHFDDNEHNIYGCPKELEAFVLEANELWVEGGYQH